MGLNQKIVERDYKNPYDPMEEVRELESLEKFVSRVTEEMKKLNAVNVQYIDRCTAVIIYKEPE